MKLHNSLRASTSTRRLTCLCLGFVAALSLQNGGVEGVTTINPQGGYTFTIAIDNNVPEPADEVELAAYISKIRDNLQRFSLNLYLATHYYFHVEKVQLVLPTSWSSSLTDSYPTATIESYSNSDIRLSSTVTYPFVLNPNQCGLPGKYIELPYTFFTGQTNDDKYGSVEKAFLTQWARFRWGVWEEHGYPSDDKFPYFYKHNENGVEEWKATGCSDVELEGEYTNTAGQPCTPTDADTTTCRFRPKETSAAKSSLMGFHWLESVRHFCDETTHNKLAPNKQNLYCNYQSVWSVIQSTPDFADLTAPPDAIPNVVVTPVKINMAPVFHLLLDRGFIADESMTVYAQVIHELLPLFKNKQRQILGAVSAFSSQNGSPNFTNLVDWMPMGPNADLFLDAIEDVRTDFPTVKDFSDGLLEVAKSIETLQPDGTPIILLIKSGATEGYFGNAQSEEDIFASFKKSGARLFVGEIPNTVELPYVNLKSLVMKTGGSQTTFNKSNGLIVQEQIKSLVALITSLLDTDEHFPIIEDKTHVMFQDRVAPADAKTIIQPSGIQDVKIHLTLSASLVPVLTVGGTEIQGTTRNEWDEADDIGRRLVHTYNIPASSQGDLTIAYSCAGCNAETSAFLLVVGQLGEEAAREITVTTETNAINNIVDFSVNSSPFVIYTTVLLSSHPVLNVAVEATITSSNNLETIVSLEDNGEGSDVAAGDGVYTGIYVPEANGVHEWSIKVETTSNVKKIKSTQSSRLLPVDQEQIGCPAAECGGVDYDGSFVKVNKMEDIEVRNAGLVERGRPSKILDLAAFAIYNTVTDETTLRLTFTSPRIVGVSNSSAQATKYYIFGSNTFADLVGPGYLGEVVCQIGNVSPPGSGEVVGQPNCPSLSVITNRFKYYVVYCFYSDFPIIPVERITKSNIAQIVDVTISDDPSTTTEDPATNNPGTDKTTDKPVTDTPTDNPGTGNPTDDPGTGNPTDNPVTTEEPADPTTNAAPGKNIFWEMVGGIALLILVAF